MTRAPADSREIADWLRHAAPGARLCADSRELARGDVFFAYPGEAADGRRYIAQAVAQGAAAVVYEAGNFSWDAGWALPQLAVAGLKARIGQIANEFYDRPDRQMFTVAVTGTNGKTSCTQWLGSVFSRLGLPAGVIGTLGAGLYRQGSHDAFESTGNTTPDALLLQRQLARFREQGVQALAVEASSIGLVQQRLSGMHIDVAVLTNLTRDHLDYHGDMAAYEAAKAMLFDWPGLKHAVVNLDDAMGRRIAQRLRQIASPISVLGYRLSTGGQEDIPALHAADIRTTPAGTAFMLHSPYGSAHVKTRLLGQFNVSNVLAITAVLLAKGIELTQAVELIETLAPVSGRMQQLGGQDAPLIVIDYAHTPDALDKVLTALRPIAQERHGKLWCVFGCGGDRDPGKRAQMGKAALAADQVIVTSDNPRSEEPAAIIAQIAEGFGPVPDGAPAHQTIEDRATAILWAVKHAAKNDVVLLAGKGHENTQEIKGKKLPFLDADHAALALAARATMKGAHE